MKQYTTNDTKIMHAKENLKNKDKTSKQQPTDDIVDIIRKKTIYAATPTMFIIFGSFIKSLSLASSQRLEVDRRRGGE